MTMLKSTGIGKVFNSNCVLEERILIWFAGVRNRDFCLQFGRPSKFFRGFGPHICMQVKITRARENNMCKKIARVAVVFFVV